MRSLAVLALLLGAAAPQQSEIKVLFLGDRGHHKPADRAKQLTPVLAEHGIAITYTEDANDLNAQKLAAFDVLILYANIDAITPDQERSEERRVGKECRS